MMFSIEDRRIIVTGSEGCIGKAIYTSLKRLGADVCGIDKIQGSTTNICCDLENEEEVKRAIEEIKKQTAPIDVLINCAGTTIEGDDKKSFDKTMKINLVAPFLLCKGIIPIMKNGSSIINITSLNADLAFPNNPAYMSSKGALKQLTKSFAYDFGKSGIRVNNLVPGYIKTSMTKKSWNDFEKRGARSDRTLLGRWGETKDLIGAVVFLSSDASSYITGIDLVVDGGWSVKGL